MAMMESAWGGNSPQELGASEYDPAMSEPPIVYPPRRDPPADPARVSGAALLRRAFPEGLDEATYRALVVLLWAEGQLSFNALAETVAAAFEVDRHRVYNDAVGAGDLRSRPPEAHLHRVRARLVRAGWEAWLREDADWRPEGPPPSPPPHPYYADRGRPGTGH
jgi:hypothetical protein